MKNNSITKEKFNKYTLIGFITNLIIFIICTSIWFLHLYETNNPNNHKLCTILFMCYVVFALSVLCSFKKNY